MHLVCNFVNVYMIAYRVHVNTCASLNHSLNPNPYLSSQISPLNKILASNIHTYTADPDP